MRSRDVLALLVALAALALLAALAVLALLAVLVQFAFVGGWSSSWSC